jgi:hypothetical protein
MYAQKLEGDSWIGEKMDLGKIDKMSGEWCWVLWVCRVQVVTDWCIDQQLGQMYELMQAIRKRELDENDPENQ